MRVPAELGRDVDKQRAVVRESRQHFPGRRFGNLVQAIRLHITDGRASAAAPRDFERRRAGRAHSERREIVTVRHVESARDDLPLLERRGAADEPNPRTHCLRVGRQSHEAHRHPRRRRIVAQHERRRTEPIHHHVGIAVAVEVGGRERV